MIDKALQHCFIRSIIDNVDPSWLVNCNFVNLYNPPNDNNKVLTCLYLKDNRRTLLYVTNKIFTTSKFDGRPWCQKYESFLKNIMPDKHLSSMFYYSGLYFDEFSNDTDLCTLREYIRLNAYDSKVLCNYVGVIRSILNYHIIPFCFSEDLLLVNADKNIILPSYNFLVSLSFPLSEDLLIMFKKRLHPCVLNVLKQKTRDRNIIANTGAYEPTKMKRICTRIIDREALLDRVYCLSSIIYYISYVGTLWKLQKQWPSQSKALTNRTNNQCTGICDYAINHLHGSHLKKVIHNYVCTDICTRLPGKLKKSTSIYSFFNETLCELERYLKHLDDDLY